MGSGPFTRFAVSHNIMAASLVAIVIFYYAAWVGDLRLSWLDLLPVGVILIGILSITHVIGGMSWYYYGMHSIRMAYSFMSFDSILIAFVIFGFSLPQ